jgi:large subunit ribosomal protein L17
MMTTLQKAKEVRPLAEKMITLGKRDNLAARRMVHAYLLKDSTAQKVFKTIAPKFADRKGGYSRIIKLGNRKGDGADLAIIELLGSELEVKKAEQGEKVDGDTTRSVAIAAALPRTNLKLGAEQPKPDVEKTAEEPKAEPKPVQPAVYTVNKGQSLWNIAREVLGDGQRFQEIIDLNPELKRFPNRLQPGQVLKLPAAKN